MKLIFKNIIQQAHKKGGLQNDIRHEKTGLPIPILTPPSPISSPSSTPSPNKVKQMGNILYIKNTSTGLAIVDRLGYFKDGDIVDIEEKDYLAEGRGHRKGIIWKLKKPIVINGKVYEYISKQLQWKKYDLSSFSGIDASTPAPVVKAKKYKVIRGGFSYNGDTLVIDSIFEGEDKGAKFLEQPAITIKYLGKDVNVPATYLAPVDNTAKVTDTSDLTGYNSKRSTIKSAVNLAGLGGGIYLAYKMKKGVWGYVGFGLLGLIAGGIAGSQISNVVLKNPQQA